MPSNTERGWESIATGRVLIGLTLSPILPITLSLPLVWAVMLDGSPASLKNILSLAFFSGGMEAWAIAVAFVGVFGVFRRRGRVSRRGLLSMASVGAFCFPTVGLIAGTLFSGPPNTDIPSMAAFFGLMGVAGIPFGLFGGWIF